MGRAGGGGQLQHCCLSGNQLPQEITTEGVAPLGGAGVVVVVGRPSGGRSPAPAAPSCRVNVGCGPAEERVLLTGLHAVADIYCENCKTTLGWKYVSDRLVLTFQMYYDKQNIYKWKQNLQIRRSPPEV